MMTFLAFVQACFFVRRLTSESNQGGKSLGAHLILLHHRITRADIPRLDHHLCYWYIRLSGAFYHPKSSLLIPIHVSTCTTHTLYLLHIHLIETT